MAQPTKESEEFFRIILSGLFMAATVPLRVHLQTGYVPPTEMEQAAKTAVQAADALLKELAK